MLGASSRLWILLSTWVLCVVCAAGCAPASRTELIVVVELGGDLEVPRDLSFLTIRVETRAGRLLRESLPFTGPDARRFPFTLGITQAEGRADAVDVFVDGFVTDVRPAVSRRVATQFVPGDRRVVHIVLERACFFADCTDGLTCLHGACIDPAVDPSTLPRYTGTLPDAGPPPDGGLDAPAFDVGVDAFVADDANLDAFTVPPDAARDANQDATTCEGDAGVRGEPAGCTLSRPPARPTCGDGGDDGFVRTVAMLDPQLDQSGGLWASRGFDLDGFCTNPVDPETPRECESPLGDPPQSDGPGGVDNVVGQAAYLSILTFVPDLQRDTERSARRGRSVPILRLRGWNGLADDARVRLDVSAAVDVLPEGTEPPPGGLEIENGLPDPRWDGTDTAYVGSNYFAAGDEDLPLISDDNAYVTGHTLVAHLPARAPIDFPVPNGVGRLRMTEPMIVAQIDPSTHQIESAVLVGRWAFVDMLDHLGDIGICAGVGEGDTFLAAFSLVGQRAMDVRSIPGSGGAGVQCDAMSAALPFVAASPVRWGGVIARELQPPGCP